MWQTIEKINLIQTEPVPKTCKFIAMILVMALTIQVSGFMFWLSYVQPLYYLSITFVLLYVLGAGIKVDGRFLTFMIILGLNALLLPTNPIFESKARYVFFAMVMIVCSPLIKTKRAILLRQYTFKYTMLAMIPLAIGSFFCFFLGINMMPFNRRNITDISMFLEYESRGGLFSGLFAHSMTMGLISALVTVIFFVAYQKYGKKIFMIMFFCAALAVVMAASRAALLALFISLFYVTIFVSNTSKNKKRIIGLLLVGVLFVSPFIERTFTGIINKQKSRLEHNDGKLNSRDDKFQARLNEFYDSPLWGIGFAAIDEHYDVQNSGQIEPGSSHLAVLSMTGLIGMCSYLIVLLYAFNTIRRSNDYKAMMLQGLFMVYFVHMWFEGYIFGAGGILCFLFWLVISQCFDYKYIKRNESSVFYQ